MTPHSSDCIHANESSHNDKNNENESNLLKQIREERDCALKEVSRMQNQIRAVTESMRLLTKIVQSEPMSKGSDASLESIGGVGWMNWCGKEEAADLEMLEDRWKLEEIGFSSLLNSCMGMRENFRLASIEAGLAVEDAREERERAASVEAEFRQLSETLRRTADENLMLKSKLERQKKRREKLVLDVREYVATMKKMHSAELDNACALKIHESILSSSSSSSGVGSSSSVDSDALDEQRTPPPSPSSERYLSSSSSLSPPSPSLLTENCSPTIRIAASDRTGPPSSPIRQASRKGSQRRPVYQITFSTDVIGLEFQAVPNSNNTNNDSKKPLLSIHENHDDSPRKQTTQSFLVCGFHNFDHSSSPPTFGSRLIAINHTSLEFGHWTLEDVYEMIRESPRPLILSFRNDILSKHQNMILRAAMNKRMRSNPRTQ